VIRRLLPVVLAILLSLPAAAQSASGGGVLALSGAWKAVRGDSPAYADPALDDRAWAPVQVPGSWEEAFPGYDGLGWYRVTVTIPDELVAGPVGLAFGTVGDAYEAYFNGVKIGGRGKFPPSFVEGVGPGLMLVPPDALAKRANGRHVLAVRVYNSYAHGGILTPVRLARYDVLAQERSPRDMVIGALVSFFMAIGVYHLVFWLRRRAARENLWFSIVCLAVSVYGTTYSVTVASLVVEYLNPYRLGLMSMLAAGPFFMALVYNLFDLRFGRRERTIATLFVAVTALAAVAPLGLLAEINKWVDAMLAVGMLAIVVRAALASSPHRPHATTLVLGTAAFALSYVYDLASEYSFVPVARVLPSVPSLFWLGFLVFVVAVGTSTAGKWALTEVTALVDPLTELARRHVLEDALRREADRLRRSGGSMALVMIDLDFFKQVNDAYGHRVGDEVLARVGRLLRSSARNIDLPARFGGEEFAVLLYDTRLDGALAFAERFRAHLRELRVPVPGGVVQVTASLGIAVGVDLVDSDVLVEAADRALYRAKSDGRDRMVGVNLAAGATSGGPMPRPRVEEGQAGD
jgi:diguanylate cyclase (GGDEF)-like protein